MKPFVGYLLNTRTGLQGEPGLAYNYLLGGNGLFLRAESPLLKATFEIAACDVRGLAPLQSQVELVHDKGQPASGTWASC